MKDEQTIRKESELDVDPRVDLAVERTMLALERTQLAWVRTVITLITAGIAIDKIHLARIIAGIAWQKNAHMAGLMLTSAGTALITLATVNYILRIRELSMMRGRKNNLLQPGILISVFIILIGALAIYSLTFTW
jgi:putative membrane protein